jgi:hypothetical protein
VFGSVAKSYLLPSWSSAAEVLGAMILAGGFQYLESLKVRQVPDAKLEKLEEKVEILTQQLQHTRAQIGFRNK